MGAVLSTLRAATMVILACVSLAGCGGGRTAAERWCEGLCTAVSRCGIHPSDCVGDCVEDRPGLASLSFAAADLEAPCIGELTCFAIRGGGQSWLNETNACWEKTVANITATARSREFCESQTRAWFDCGYLLSNERCAKDYALWSDPVLDLMALCARTASCDNLVACERRAVEGQ
jgi:hypothetical protein